MAVIEQLLAQYGYLTVAVGVGAESMGAPLPGETILIVASAYAGATHHLSPTVVVIVAAAAAIAGDNAGYWLGRRYGPRILTAADRRLSTRARHLHTVLRLFDRHGSVAVVGGRFISVVRTYAAFGAGATGMGWRKFLTLNTLGGVGWAALLGFGSAALGASAGTTATYILAALAAICAGCLALVVRVRTHRTRSPADRPDSATRLVTGSPAVQPATGRRSRSQAEPAVAIRRPSRAGTTPMRSLPMDPNHRLDRRPPVRDRIGSSAHPRITGTRPRPIGRAARRPKATPGPGVVIVSSKDRPPGTRTGTAPGHVPTSGGRPRRSVSEPSS